MTDYSSQYQAYLRQAEDTLAALCEKYLPESSEVCRAARYSLLGGGKRVRAVLVLAVCDMLKGDMEAAAWFAGALEMVHCYSLIHDDLPCMDNDDFRRGRPSCHKAFSESTAMLAGDALLTAAFSVLSESPAPDGVRVAAVQELASGAGAAGGMILGQTLDIAAEAMQELDRAQLEEIHLHKTGCLLTLPLLCAAVLAGHEEDLPILKQIGSLIGLSFQIQDDVMDVTESQQQLGKSNSDIANHKATFVTLMGVEDARALSDACYREAKALCAQLHLDTQGLLSLFDQLRERRS